MKKIFLKISLLVLFLSVLILPWARTALAQTAEPVDIYFFYGDGCPHCAKEELFLDKIKDQFGAAIDVHYYELWHNRDNASLLQEVVKLHPIATASVPITLIGDQSIIGYQSDDTTGQQILDLIGRCQAGTIGECPVKNLLDSHGDDKTAAVAKSAASEVPTVRDSSTIINIPFLGQRDAKSFSLPVLSVIIGTLDGFNPCAMWVLIFLLSLLIGVDSNARRWLIGGVFIFASGFMYFLFMAAWLQAFLFLGYLWYIRLGIGVFAVAFGAYNLRDYWQMRKTNHLECKVTGSEKRQRIFARLREVALEKKIIPALIGIIALAFAVNLVELACSAGFPAIYTSVLAYSGVPSWQKYLYIFIYIFFYILDDIIVYLIAMMTMQATGFGGKYAKYSNLIGGLVILILGTLLIFRPNWLSFG